MRSKSTKKIILSSRNDFTLFYFRLFGFFWPREGTESALLPFTGRHKNKLKCWKNKAAILQNVWCEEIVRSVPSCIEVRCVYAKTTFKSPRNGKVERLRKTLTDHLAQWDFSNLVSKYHLYLGTRWECYIGEHLEGEPGTARTNRDEKNCG